MSELITKEELLEWGFTKGKLNKQYYMFGRVAVDMARGFTEILIIYYDDTSNPSGVWGKATKANVIKMIEIAKLIGELK